MQADRSASSSPSPTSLSAGRKRSAHSACIVPSSCAQKTWCAGLSRGAGWELEGQIPVVGTKSQSAGQFYGAEGEKKLAIYSACFPRIREQEENTGVLV